MDARFWAHDSSGDPVSGATLTIYNAGTTTLASVYRDSTLSTAMSNPTSGLDVSDSSGRFPQIFAAEGISLDILMKTSAGVVITSYDDVIALGSGAAIFTRDFGNSRARIAGSGGVVSYEAGDPAGDNVGGQVRLGGYNNTQANTASIDAAAVNTTGIFTENGKKLTGVVSSSAGFSGVTEINLQVPNSPAGIQAFQIDLLNLVGSTTATTYCRFSYDNGSTYETTSYQGGSSGEGILSGGDLSSSTPTSHCLRLVTASSLNVSSLSGITMTSSATATGFIHNGNIASKSRVTNVKVYPSTGTFSGRARVIPMRGTGDA